MKSFMIDQLEFYEKYPVNLGQLKRGNTVSKRAIKLLIFLTFACSPLPSSASDPYTIIPLSSNYSENSLKLDERSVS